MTARRRVWRGAGILAAVCVLCMAGCADPEVTRAKYTRQGNELLTRGEFAKARVEFLNALRINPNDADARYGAGQAFEHVGSLQQAVGHYLAAVEVDPAHIPSQLALARIFTYARQIETANAHVEKVLQIEPANRDARSLRASLLILQDNRAEARTVLDGVIAEDPSHEIAVPLLTSLMMSAGDEDGAKVVIANATRQRPTFPGFRAVYAQILYQTGDQVGYLEQLKTLAELEPNVQQHYAALSRALAKAGRADEAKQLLRGRAQNSESKIAYLQFLEELGALREAESEFDRFLAEDPKDDETRYAFGEFLERSGRMEEAERTYHELATGDAAHNTVVTKAQLASARILMARSEYGAARKLIAAVREAHASNQQAILLAGQMAMAAGDPDAAIGEFRLALRDDPQNIDLYRLLASAYFANDQGELARETLERAVAIDSGSLDAKVALVQVRMTQGDDAGAESVVDEILLSAPRNLFALEQKYKIRLRQTRLDDAVSVGDEIANLYPRSGMGPFFAGAALQAKGDTERAIPRYREALERQPGAAEPLSSLIRILLAAGKVDAARDVLNDQLQRVAEPFLVRKFLGDVEASQGKADAAAALYVQAMKERPQFAMTYVALANLEQSRGRVEEELRVLREGIAATDDPRLHIQLGDALQRTQRIDDAVEVYRFAMSKHDKDPTIANNLAMLLAEFQPTAENLNQALQLTQRFEESDNPAYLDTLGWIYFKRGELEPSERILKRAVERAPRSALLQYHLAKVLVDRGNSQEALTHLETAIASGQRFTGLDDARVMHERLSQS